MTPEERVRFLEWFWLEAWNRRDLDELLGHVHPDYVQHDHRLLSTWGMTKDAWREQNESWWAILPDARCVEAEVVAAEADRALYGLRFVGTDTVSGGAAEIVFQVVNRFADNRFLRADVFEDAAAARAFYDAERCG
jgi:ketosteroid isomerase-like protein